MTSSKKINTCEKGHIFLKTSRCPVCPVCESNNKPEGGFIDTLAAPARRAMKNNGITTLQQLSQLREEELLAFHGIGKGSLPKLRTALAAVNLCFRD